MLIIRENTKHLDLCMHNLPSVYKWTDNDSTFHLKKFTCYSINLSNIAWSGWVPFIPTLLQAVIFKLKAGNNMANHQTNKESLVYSWVYFSKAVWELYNILCIFFESTHFQFVVHFIVFSGSLDFFPFQLERHQ